MFFNIFSWIFYRIFFAKTSKQFRLSSILVWHGGRTLCSALSAFSTFFISREKSNTTRHPHHHHNRHNQHHHIINIIREGAIPPPGVIITRQSQPTAVRPRIGWFGSLRGPKWPSFFVTSMFLPPTCTIFVTHILQYYIPTHWP